MSILSTAGDVITHDNTKTSRSLRQVEKQLANDINQLIMDIRKEIDPLQPWYSISQHIKPVYGQQIYDLIRAATQEAYILGNQYVASLKIFVNLPSYLTQTDIMAIESLSQIYYDKFWGRVVISVSRRADKAFGIIQRMQEPPDTFLNPNFIVTSIATTLTTHALNIATLAKIRRLAINVNPFIINKNILQAAATIQDVEIMWVTSNDERVCPICRPLHGHKWPLGDDTIPIPPQQSHQRCRCRLVVITPKP